MTIREFSLCNGIAGRVRDMKMKYIVIGLAFAVISACATPLDLSPRPVAGASDPAWIRESDARLMDKQAKHQADHHGSADSQVILWKNLECVRRTHIAQLRAAYALMRSEGMTRGDALSKVQADPLWFIAKERCR